MKLMYIYFSLLFQITICVYCATIPI
ncbi:hypothetical protein I7I48_09904 [Histoplasma ohiense]|nr:hypothetical protein I7I48_09904 [Histoplasma ohiense (nom. inval.)]